MSHVLPSRRRWLRFLLLTQQSSFILPSGLRGSIPNCRSAFHLAVTTSEQVKRCENKQFQENRFILTHKASGARGVDDDEEDRYLLVNISFSHPEEQGKDNRRMNRLPANSIRWRINLFILSRTWIELQNIRVLSLLLQEIQENNTRDFAWYNYFQPRSQTIYR